MSEQPVNPFQAMVNGMGAAWALERAETQLTLGKLISKLESIDPDLQVRGLGELNSYRGYCTDLAFAPSNTSESAGDLLLRCRSAMGKIFEGYKGGDFPMHANTPLWVASYGQAPGPRLMDLDLSNDLIVPLVEPEE